MRKEYHVFDSLDSRPSGAGSRGCCTGSSTRRARRSTRWRPGRPTDPTYLGQAAMIADEQLYFDYFTALFARSARPG